MFNFNLLIKKIKKILISVNELIESFFNNLQKFIKLQKSKKNYIKQVDNKIILIVGASVLLILSYFLIPTLHNKEKVKISIENQIKKKYDFELKFNKELNYGLFPKPHFFSKDLSFFYNKKNIATSKHFKVFIAFGDLLSFNEIKIKDIFIKKTEFNINSNSINFFKDIFNSKKNQNEIIFKDSKVFYKDKNDEVLFLSKINNLDFLMDREKLNNEMSTKFEVFNVPISFDVTDINKSRKIFTKLKSKKVRLKIENEFNYDNENIYGLLNLQIINDYHSFDYTIDKNSLNFSSSDEQFNGKIDFKPFYLLSNMNFNQLNFKDAFKDNSIITDLINSEILNNQNLNANFNLNFKKISNSNYLRNFKIKLFLQEGRLLVKNSSIDWNDSILIKLNEIELLTNENQIKLVGTVFFEFRDITTFYSYYQIRRNNRSNIKTIKLDFLYDLNQEKITLDNFKIDNKDPKNIDEFLSLFNTQNKNIFNKVTFRNFIKDFFSVYEG